MLKNLKSIAHRIRLTIIERSHSIVLGKNGCSTYLLAVALMGLALWLRLAIAPVNAGLQYVTFFPVVTLAAIAGGLRVGLFATVIGLIFATCIFTSPYYSFSIEVLHASFWSNMVFLLDGIIVSFSIEAMHRYRCQYALKMKQDALQENEVATLKKTDAEKRIADTAFESQQGLMITDAHGVILRVNNAFTNITGFTFADVIGKNPRMLSSGLHDANFYAEMWDCVNRTGGWEGDIYNRRKNCEIYPQHLTITAVKNDEGITSNYVSTLADITLSKNAEEKIQTLLFQDPVTNLPNRRLFMDRLNHALASSSRSGKAGALLLIDLDDFRKLNDTLGHDIGDLLLQQVAQRLKSCVRECDTVARLGGDEFLVMVEDLSEQTVKAASQTEAIGEKILSALNEPYQLGANKFLSTPSIGAVLFNDSECRVDELLKQVDIAMYQAKTAGRNTIRFFDLNMQVALNTRTDLEDELRKALENRQFHLYYQIQVDNLCRPLGAEVLIRWIHPDRGLVSPVQFIPLAEETGLIIPIGQWVLETACAQLKMWEHNVHTSELVLAVNVSAKQFRQIDFSAQVQSAIQRHAIDPSRLKLELTESLLLDNIEDIISTMNALHEIGVQFSLDDFGTGYSSLQYLKRLPLDQLKIDQSFVRDIASDSSDRSIVQTIIAMAHSLNMSVIAEGVETEDQREFLLNNGCTHYQGYLFSKPVPIEQFEDLMINTYSANRSRLHAVM